MRKREAYQLVAYQGPRSQNYAIWDCEHAGVWVVAGVVEEGHCRCDGRRPAAAGPGAAADDPRFFFEFLGEKFIARGCEVSIAGMSSPPAY